MAPAVTSLSLGAPRPRCAILFVQMLYVTMVYGPIAAYLVELFPTSIRYTSMSLPYHLGNGWFGGFLPLIATAVTTSAWARETFGAGAIYTGLIYPIAVCVMTVVVGGLYIRETKDHKIDTPIAISGAASVAYAGREATLRYHVLAADYDGTLAQDGAVDDATLAALRAAEGGRPPAHPRHRPRAGRAAGDLPRHRPVCDLVVAENGAVVYDPATRQARARCARAPPDAFVDDLRRSGVEPLSVGRAIVATWRPHEAVVLDAIRRPRPRAARRLQQGRGHGAALGRQQGERAGGRPGRAGAVAAQRGRGRRRGERPRLPRRCASAAWRWPTPCPR